MKTPIASMVALAVALGATAALASGGPPATVVSPSHHIAGKTYSQWMTASWQWILAHGHAEPPRHTGVFSCIKSSQRGKVWFLQDEYEQDAPVTVNCEVPAGRYLFIEGPTFDCSTVEPPPFYATPSGLAACARKFRLGGAELTVDGRVLHPSAYAVATPVFGFTMPAVGNILKVSGRTSGFAAAIGEATMLRPLSRGRHTIVQLERFSSGSAVQTTWRITVR